MIHFMVHRKTNPAVRKFAMLMVKDHSKNLSDTLKLSASLHERPLSSSTAMSLQKEGKEELAKLQGLKNPNLQSVYVADMVKGHSAALNLLNQSIDKVSNPRLKQHLINTRVTVKHHLSLARALQARME